MPRKAETEQKSAPKGGSYFTNFGNHYYASSSSDEDDDNKKKRSPKQRPAADEGNGGNEPSTERPNDSNPNPRAVVPVPHSRVEVGVHSYYPPYDSYPDPPPKPLPGYTPLGWGGYPPSDGAPPPLKPKPNQYHEDYQLEAAGGYRRPPPAAAYGRPPRQQPYAYGYQQDDGGYDYGGYHMYSGWSPPHHQGGYGSSHCHSHSHSHSHCHGGSSPPYHQGGHGAYHRFHGHRGHGGYGHGYPHHGEFNHYAPHCGKFTR